MSNTFPETCGKVAMESQCNSRLEKKKQEVKMFTGKPLTLLYRLVAFLTTLVLLKLAASSCL